MKTPLPLPMMECTGSKPGMSHAENEPSHQRHRRLNLVPPSGPEEALGTLTQLVEIASHIDSASIADISEVLSQTGAVRGSQEPWDEKRLRLAEARYRTLIEQIPAVTFLASLAGGANEIYVSPQIESLLGFTQEEWINDPILWFRQTHPDDRGWV